MTIKLMHLRNGLDKRHEEDYTISFFIGQYFGHLMMKSLGQISLGKI